MATKVSGSFDLSGQSLISALRKRAGRREGSSNFIGLQRSLALSDVDDPTKSLNNVLDKISLLLSAERNQYGSGFNAVDWDVTRDFINERIDKAFLSRLANASIGGGSLGSTVSITPRIRIQDRLNFLNSFYGEGSFAGLHSGPDAQFYKAPTPLHIGFIKFSFNEISGSMTVTELKGPDGTSDITTSSVLGSESVVVLDLSQYSSTGVEVDLEGLGISARLQSPSTWTVEGDSALEKLNKIKLAVGGAGTFAALRFRLVRPYSFLNTPKWFSESPSVSSESVAGSADDLNPTTSPRVLRNDNGAIVPFVQKGYWYSRGYVETRWSPTELSLVTNNGANPSTVVEDSNMRWQEPPSKLRAQTYNWGIRWDGFLRVTEGTYAFEIQTNAQVKIDMAIASGGGWENVFSTFTAAKQGDQLYISSSTFNTSALDNRYKYFQATGWVAYVPITIRMYYGGPDKVQPEEVISSEPNLFIKTTSLPSTKTFYSRDYSVTLAGTDGAWTLTSSNLATLISILQDANASVSYSLTALGTQVLATPLAISLTTNGTTVSSATTGLAAGTYTLAIRPNRPTEFNANLYALWKGRIASPQSTHKSYADLIDGSFTPDIQKIAFDSRPEWWKVSEGHSYNNQQLPSSSNDPLDGFVRNSFKSVLKSDAPGVGLYGNGGSPATYTSRPNMILGEARFGVTDTLGSNYIGVRILPNLLGEGGRFTINALPVNNATFTDSTLLGQNDLGGGSNYLTFAGDKLNPRVMQVYLWTNPTIPSTSTYNKYFLHINLTNVTQSDNPVTYGLPPFSSNQWLSPITIMGTRVASDSALTTPSNFVSPLPLTAEKITLGAYDLLAFSVNLPSILDGGGEVNQFSGKYLQFFTEDDLAFQYSRVDTGESLSFADVLKLTYTGTAPNYVFQGASSEIPRPPSDRVTPFGFDKPQFSTGLCYPPYSIGNPLLSSVAIEDTPLYTTPSGNYDVFWGDPTKSGLGGNTLTLTEKIEFQSADATGIETLSSPPTVLYSQYTHRLKIDSPLQGSFDEDVLEHIGNGEKVKESYYAYVQLA
jgi:hypothetical protein